MRQKKLKTTTMTQNLGLNLTRNEMRLILGGIDNPCYPVTCCIPPDSPDCVAGPCTGPGGCVSFCQCGGVIK